MANVNIFEKFGIKEVANVYFEALSDEEASGVKEGDIVLFLDTLKVSTIETTAENTDARGGWGNPKLITWDFAKEITLSLTDALLSFESARIMLGGTLRDSQKTDEKVDIHYTAEVTGAFSSASGKIENPSSHSYFKKSDLNVKSGTEVRYINLTKGFRGTATFTVDSDVTDKDDATTKIAFNSNEVADTDKIRLFWVVEKTGKGNGNEAVEITISPDVFPGTYKIVGDTFMRSQVDGKDYPFQFIIGKAKMLSEVTITMEAEGDPSTFDMTISVLKDNNGDLMKLVRYDLVDEAAPEEDDATE